MDKRYQVFVSSTYEDLQEERQEVMQALLELDCIPAGMELFPAADETQWSLIKRVIDECDYYVVIVGGRYGSCDNDDVGFTEKEYRYALEIGKPTIAFLHKDPAKIVAGKTEQTDKGKRKLGAFRSLLQEKLCKPWSDPSELKAVVITSLTQLKRTRPAIGWVRADELPDEDATREMLKLRQRIDELEAELDQARAAAPKGSEDLAHGNDRQRLGFTYLATSQGGFIGDTCESEFEATWDSIFASVAPRMTSEITEHAMKPILDAFVQQHNEARLYEANPKYVSVDSFSLKAKDFHAIKVQLKALGLIAKGDRPRKADDDRPFWILTPHGEEVMTRIVAVKRPAPAGKKRAKRKPSKKK